MSAGAVFKLIANDGKADRMIMATKLLNQRIKDVMCARKRAGKADITPTLVDLERTHILYVNAHFKPFAAIGYEYNKVRPQSGTPSLGAGVTFSIPQFGDFFHDMVCRTRLSQFASKIGTTPKQSGAAGTGSTNVFPFNGVSDGVNYFYNIVDSNGVVLVKGLSSSASPGSIAANVVSYRNYVRYCEYPGNRLFRLVKFDVNGNPLDQYDEMIPTMLEKFCTPPNKRTGHDRLVGQEVPLTGYSGICNSVVVDADKDSTPKGITKVSQKQSNQSLGLFAPNPVAATVGAYTIPAGKTLAVSSAGFTSLNEDSNSHKQYDVSRKVQQIVNGPQTPKPAQPPLEIWNKLRFWFNDDVRLSIASVSIPFGQRFISIDINQQSLLTYEFPSIYLETIADTSTLAVAATGTSGSTGFVPAIEFAAGVRTYSYKPIFQKCQIEDVTIDLMELYINNIFVNPEVHDIYIKRIGFSLIRVYRQHTQRCSQEGAEEKLLSQLKWPIEYMFIGIRPVWNIKDATPGTSGLVTAGNQNQWRDWHRLTRMVDASCDSVITSYTPNGLQMSSSGSQVAPVMPDQYFLPVPTVDTMSLTSHGIVIFDGFCDTFFNQYLPFHYGGPALVTPDDPGALFINMALFPRSYQPSGHLNISRARETYLKFTTSYVSNKTPADLLAVAVAINFLLITDGSAVLRYST
jgi:hypothetical protein